MGTGSGQQGRQAGAGTLKRAGQSDRGDARTGPSARGRLRVELLSAEGYTVRGGAGLTPRRFLFASTKGGYCVTPISA